MVIVGGRDVEAERGWGKRETYDRVGTEVITEVEREYGSGKVRSEKIYSERVYFLIVVGLRENTRGFFLSIAFPVGEREENKFVRLCVYVLVSACVW